MPSFVRQVDHSLQIDGGEGEQLEEPFLKGEVQEPAYRDTYFACAFGLQIVGVILTAVVYGPSAFVANDDDSSMSNNTSEQQTNYDAPIAENNNNGEEDEDNGDLLISKFIMVSVTALLGAILSTMGMMSIMTKWSTRIVEISFFLAPILLFVVGVIFSIINPDSGTVLIFASMIFAAISACVYCCYRRFIPFAASTLRTAVAAVRMNQGLYGVAFGAQIVTFLTSVLFLVTLMGLYTHADQKGGEALCKDLYDDPDNEYGNDEMCLKNPPIIGFVILLFCSFWTQQVIQNVVHCTTAGAVGSWWFSSLGDPSWCSHEITGSLGRATTYSFGSICFGSLLVAIMQTLEHMAKSSRRNRDSALLACILECILFYLRAWLEYFNSWAFCYVGLYGYDYLTAGKNVVQLFKSRGWSSFASDRLIFRVLYFSLLSVALFSGCVAALADAAMGPMFRVDDGQDDGSTSIVLAFLIGYLVGLILSRCSLFVLESAVRTVIVCFAESPAEFAMHHPELCDGMKEGWSAAYPTVWTEDYELRFAEVLTTTQASNKTSSEEEEKGLIA